jgi:N6-adenosine-specific RNA methylase IME4
VTPFRCLVADPPWRANDSLGPRGAEANYDGTLSVEEVKKFPLPPMAEDSEVAEAWGFEVTGDICWVKLSSPMRTQFLGPSSAQEEWMYFKLHFGLGRTTRAAKETCLVCRRGKPKPLVKNERDVFFAPVGEHSAKPDEFMELVERLTPGPRAELFARRCREGWTQWGNQLEGRPASPAEGA